MKNFSGFITGILCFLCILFIAVGLIHTILYLIMPIGVKVILIGLLFAMCAGLIKVFLGE